MAGSRTGGVTFELEAASKRNLDKQLGKLKKQAPKTVFKGLVQFLFDIKTLAQLKLKRDGHIITSRLRNSLFVKTLNQIYAKRGGNKDNYSAEGKTYKSDLDVKLKEGEAAIGTNVEYAGAIEFGYGPHIIEAKNKKVLGTPKVGFFGKKVNHPGFKGDSFLYWALKHADIEKRGREIGKELLNDIK